MGSFRQTMVLKSYRCSTHDSTPVYYDSYKKKSRVAISPNDVVM